MADMLGVMVDCSRNAVMNVPSVKRFAELLAKMGYNTLMLYTEDIYEIQNQPAFGHLRGRYSVQELKELDSFCNSIGIELVPCIQTLAHLNCIFKWNGVYQDIQDIDDILLAEENKTYRLVEDMFSTLAGCFTSRRIHIGMDEANSVGLGKYLQKHGPQNRFDIINRHLHKVCQIADKYGFKPMIWSDMFCKLALGTTSYYDTEKGIVDSSVSKLPENVSLVYWDYYTTEYDRYRKMIAVNQSFGREVIFAGGAVTWQGFVPNNRLSIDVNRIAAEACRDGGVKNMLFTLWGDDGGECSRFAALPALFYAAEAVRGNTDEASVREKFNALMGCEYDSFLLLDQVDYPGLDKRNCTHKYLLYSDPFMGISHSRARYRPDAYYAELCSRLQMLELPEEYGSVKDYLAALSDLLSIKNQLCLRTREAYDRGDREMLQALAETDYSLAIEKVKVFHKLYRRQWMLENKPNGFELQDIRLGGLIQRLSTCRERLLEYCSGQLSSIPELEEPLLDLNVNASWARIVTPGIISHYC